MGWGFRNGRRYDYEAARVGRRVVKRYVGSGRVAELCAQLSALDADQRTWARIDRGLAAAVGGDGTPGSAAVKTRAADLRRALAGATPNPVELLLAERAVVCWAVCHQYELLYFSALDTSRSHAAMRSTRSGSPPTAGSWPARRPWRPSAG